MASVCTYLNLPGNTEEAFTYYRTVFNTEFMGTIVRFGELPAGENMPPLPDELKNKVMNIAMPILAGHVLMGTDALEPMGFQLKPGNNVYITLQPDTHEETERLFRALSAGGKIEQDLQDTFWGAYYGSCRDQFGVQWMFNCQLN